MRRLACALAAATVLAVPAIAEANSIRQVGEIIGDKPSKVQLKLKTRNGDPRAILNFKARNVRTRCNGKPSRIDFTVIDPVRVNENRAFRIRLSDQEGGILRISGKVRGNNRRVVGNLKTNEIESSDGKTCKTPKQRWRTTAD